MTKRPMLFIALIISEYALVFLKFYSHEKKSPNSEQPPVGEDKGKIYVITFGTVHRTLHNSVREEIQHMITEY